jgi:hypothetical protein
MDEGWFKQPHLAQTLGWVRLLSCCTLTNQCAEVKPAITNHTVREMHGSIEHQVMHQWRPTPPPPPCVLVWRSPLEANLVVCSNRHHSRIPKNVIEEEVRG